MLKDGQKYDFSKRGKLQQEDYLRNGLVDDYLSKRQNKEYYKNFISDNPAVEIYFQKEENHTHRVNGELADDYIDISIKETELSNALSGETDDEIKFAVECKRIKEAKDYNEYVKDIGKFVNRPFTTHRLQYEGQIAFVEDANLNHTHVSEAINTRLRSSSVIDTIQYLSLFKFHESFDGSYLSAHKRNYYNKSVFSIFHLLLDYSKIVSG
jgi:hypothetical protein